MIDIKFILATLISLSLISASLIVMAIICNNLWINLLVGIITAAPIFLLPFTLLGSSLFTLVILILISVILLLMKYDIKLHTRIVLSHIFGPKLTLLIMSFSLIIAVQLFLTTNRLISNNQIAIPTQYIDTIFTISEPLVKQQLSAQQDVLTNALIHSLDEQFPYLAKIPVEDKTALLNGQLPRSVHNILVKQGFSEKQIVDFVKQIQSQTESKTGADFTTSILDQVKTQVQDMVNHFINTNKGAIPWIMSITTFLTLTSLSIVIKYLAIIFAKFMLILLSITGLIKKESINMPIERYVINETTQEVHNDTSTSN